MSAESATTQLLIALTKQGMLPLMPNQVVKVEYEHDGRVYQMLISDITWESAQ